MDAINLDQRLRAADAKFDRMIGFELALTKAATLIAHRDDLPVDVRLSLFADIAALCDEPAAPTETQQAAA